MEGNEQREHMEGNADEVTEMLRNIPRSLLGDSEKIGNYLLEQKNLTKQLQSNVEETRNKVSQVSEDVSKVSADVSQVSESVRRILARKGFYNWLVAALAIIGGILTLGLVILLGMGRSIPEGYIAIITAIVGAMAGSLIPQS